MSLPVINTTGTHRKPDNLYGSPPDCLVAIVSTIGAAEEISTVLRGLPANTSAGFLVLPDVRLGFSRLLCERLQVDCSLPVYEVNGETTLAQAEVFVTPAQISVNLARSDDGSILLYEPNADTTTESSNRLVRILKSAAEVFRQELTVVILSGMEGDIIAAATAAKDLGARILAQSEATTLIHDAPHAVIEAKLADDVLPLWAIGGRITDLLESRR